MITFVSYRQDNPHAALSSIPLDKLPNKDFHRAQIEITAPIVEDVKVQEQQTDEETEVVVNRRDLFKKFNYFVQNKMINLTHEALPMNPSRQALRDDSASQN